MIVESSDDEILETAEEAAEADRIIVKMMEEVVVEMAAEMAAENEAENEVENEVDTEEVLNLVLKRF